MRTHVKRTQITGAMVALAVAIGAVVPALAARSIETKVTISKKAPRFHGTVKSDRSACLAHRKVRVVRNSKLVLGTTHTDDHGNWLLRKRSPHLGVYHAEVSARTTQGVTCGKGYSDSIAIGFHRR